MIKIISPDFIGFFTECKVIFTCRKRPATLINDKNIFKAEFSRFHPEHIPFEDAEFLKIPISERKIIMLSFSLSVVYQKNDEGNWVRKENSYFRKRNFSIDDEYLTLRGLLYLGLDPDEVYDERVNERYDFIIIFKRTPLLIEVINKVFTLKLE